MAGILRHLDRLLLGGLLLVAVVVVVSVRAGARPDEKVTYPIVVPEPPPPFVPTTCPDALALQACESYLATPPMVQMRAAVDPLPID